MANAAEIKMVASLREKKYRKELGLFVVEGRKMVQEALDSAFEVVKVYSVEEDGQKAMERMSSLDTPPPVLATVRIPAPGVSTLIPLEGLFLGLDAVRDPGNFGTILRLSDWFGVDGIYASADCADAYNPKTVQSSMGSIFRQKITFCDLPALCRDYSGRGGQIFGTFLDGEDIYREDLPQDALVVMGNEANGIGEAVAGFASRRISIPSFHKAGGGPESLNVAVATAVTLSEFKRRHPGR